MSHWNRTRRESPRPIRKSNGTYWGRYAMRGEDNLSPRGTSSAVKMGEGGRDTEMQIGRDCERVKLVEKKLKPRPVDQLLDAFSHLATYKIPDMISLDSLLSPEEMRK